LILLAITLMAGVTMLVMVFNGNHEPTLPAASQRPYAQTAANHAPAPDPIAPSSFTPPIAGPPAGPMGILLSATSFTLPAAPRETTAHAGRATRAVPPSTPSPTALAEQAAADALAAGRIQDALLQYQTLALTRREVAVYGQIATILRRKLEAQQHDAPAATVAP
jgi:hypothetical protein